MGTTKKRREKLKKRLASCLWMIEGRWRLPDGTVIPIRSAAVAENRREAQKKADEAVALAVKAMMKNGVVGKQHGKAFALYAFDGIESFATPPTDGGGAKEGT